MASRKKKYVYVKIKTRGDKVTMKAYPTLRKALSSESIEADYKTYETCRELFSSGNPFTHRQITIRKLVLYP